MVKKTLNNLTPEVFQQSIPLTAMIITISSGLACYVFYSSYSETGSLTQLSLANLFLLVTIILLKPITEWRSIKIDHEFITIFKLFYKPIKINISESLFQVVIQQGEIRSFRFKEGENYTQISPIIYKNGNRLSKRLKDHITRNKLVIEVVD